MPKTHPLRKAILILAIAFNVLPVFGQLPAGLKGSERIEIKRFYVLPDRDYSPERIRTDASLVFVREDSLRPSQANRYWLKLEATNRSRYAQPCRLTVLPKLDNTLFYFDEDADGWIARRAGIAVATDHERVKGQMHLTLQGHTTTTFYVQVNLGGGYALPKAIKPRVVLERETAVQEKEHFFNTTWIVSLVILLISFLNNLHVCYRFRDRTVLYFLITQLGGMLYITAYRYFFNIAFSAPPFSLRLLPDGTGHFYNTNTLLMHISVAVIVYGTVHMTRSYLQTKMALPTWDIALRYALYGYLVFSLVVALVNAGGFYLDAYTLLYDNMLVLGVIVMLLATGIVGYRRKLPSAPAYLFANVLPLLLLMSIALYHVLVSFDNQGQLLLPDLVIISQALCFSAAIIARIQILQDHLLAKEAEARQLALDIGQSAFRQQELALENEQIQAAFREMELQRKVAALETAQLSVDMLQQQSANKDLQEKLEANQRELASTTLYMAQKNAMLAELKGQIEELNKLSPNHQHKELSGIKDILQSNLYLDEDWNKFKLHFEQVHPHFFEELLAKYPSLTKNELRLLSYFHINLSTKEIAALLNIDPASVRTAKTRLHKKMAAAGKGPAPKQSGESANEPPTGA